MKRKRLDDVDIIDKNVDTKSITDTIAEKHAKAIMSAKAFSYWDSPEAYLLFVPLKGESVHGCLRRRNRILVEASRNDNALHQLLSDVEDIEVLSVKQKEQLRLRCIYLNKAYEVAIQYMNSIGWVECVKIAIDELRYCDIDYISNERTVRRWHTEFRTNEKFNISFVRSQLEPKLFSFFPKARSELLEYCTKKVKTGELSIEYAHYEVTKKIVPRCYEELLLEAGEKSRDAIPKYEDVFQMLDLKKIHFDTVWRWITNLGFHYDVNEKSYYIDGHKREDVVADRNNRFLVNYFAYELKCHRWVQISEAIAQSLEDKSAIIVRNH